MVSTWLYRPVNTPIAHKAGSGLAQRTVLDGQHLSWTDRPLVLWHLVLYGLSTGPRDKGYRVQGWPQAWMPVLGPSLH